MAITYLPMVEPKITYFSLTHTSGDAAETLQVTGAVYKVELWVNDAGTLRNVAAGITTSATSGVTTISVAVNTDITNGVLIVYHTL